MAYSFNQGSSAIAASDQIGSSTHWPYAKLAYGAAGTANIVSSALPFPVTGVISSGTFTLSSNPTVIPSSAVSVAGTVAVSSGTFTLSSASPGVDYNISAGEWEQVAAGQTQQALGSSAGRIGDYISMVMVVPASTTPGAVTLYDSTAGSIPLFVGGVVPSAMPFPIPLGMISVSSGWKITTGASVSVIAVGNFT